MAYVPTTFVDRSVEFPNRRTLTAVSGQADTFDVARAEGTVFVEGTKPDAANLNAEFGKIKTETDSINTSLTAPTVGMFIYDYQDGKYGFNTNPNRGADTFVPFSEGGENFVALIYGFFSNIYTNYYQNVAFINDAIVTSSTGTSKFVAQKSGTYSVCATGVRYGVYHVLKNGTELFTITTPTSYDKTPDRRSFEANAGDQIDVFLYTGGVSGLDISFHVYNCILTFNE